MSERYLGIDAGRVRIGLAISDPENRYAMPLEVVPAREALKRIRIIAAEQNISRIIVGLPLTLRGEEGPQARRVRRFAKELAEAINPMPIDFQDERMTSLEADKRMAPESSRKMRDAVAAAIMLEAWLGKRNHLDA